MAVVVEEKYRVNIYLDTNILVDYVEKSYPLLNRSIDYLAQCPFVNLRSSHYVLYEFTEVRKIRLFWKIAKRRNNSSGSRFGSFIKKILRFVYKDNLDCNSEYRKARAIIRRTWKYNGMDYNDFKTEISNTVNDELNLLRMGLLLNFDEHVLHEELVYPTNSLCLATKITKEDCLVMVSCMNPNIGVKLDHCLLLSRDEQYFKAYYENSQEADVIFNNSQLNRPTMIRTENLQIGGRGQTVSLYENAGQVNIEEFWIRLILETLRVKLSDQYVGRTYNHGIYEAAKKCIFFEMDGDDKTLRESDGLCFIANDLSIITILGGPFEFWNNQKISLPYSNPGDSRYSFLKEDVKPEILGKLREGGNLVFYYN